MLIIAGKKKVFVLRHMQGLSATIIRVHRCWTVLDARPPNDATVASSVFLIITRFWDTYPAAGD